MDIYIPDHTPEDAALSRTTHLAISAHQDDIEIMAYHGALHCFGNPDEWFTGAVVTDGAGSPRSGIYADYTDEQMKQVRVIEQQRAANVGGYGAQVFLNLSSAQVKDAGNTEAVEALKQLIQKARPRVIYTHNLADKHPTHVAVALRVLAALRELGYMPDALYGCEVWRGLDWMCDSDKTVLDVSGRPNLENALLGVFDSQIAGGKRYDLAAVGRRLANATFSESHGVDASPAVTYAMDLLPLLREPDMQPAVYVQQYIKRLEQDVTDTIRRMS